MVVGVLPVGYLSLLGKGKGKISEIKHPGDSEYLRAVVRYADAVGPSWVDPSFAKVFATRYRLPSSVRIWCPDLLTSYVVSVPKMVCFFEAAFENGLRFPLHPFIKKRSTTFQCMSGPTLSQFLGRLGWPFGFF